MEAIPAVGSIASVPALSAQCAVVMDMTTGSVLLSKNQNQSAAIASTTKIMTCLLACESGRLNETVTVDREMLTGLEGTSVNLKHGDTVLLSDLVKGALLASGNDAANAIAFYLAGSKEAFAALMNRRAAALGMKNTRFVTPSGLDEGDHRSTALDMALLACAALKNETLAAVAAEKSDTITVSGAKRTLLNHNKLLSLDDGFIGLKTGYTKKAGRCLVSAYRYEGNTVICVTLNAPDDWNDHLKLVSWVKEAYQPISGGETLSIPLVGAAKGTVSVRFAYAVTACASLVIKVYYYPFAYAPVTAGEPLGFAEIYCENVLLQRVELTATENSS